MRGRREEGFVGRRRATLERTYVPDGKKDKQGGDDQREYVGKRYEREGHRWTFGRNLRRSVTLVVAERASMTESNEDAVALDL